MEDENKLTLEEERKKNMDVLIEEITEAIKNRCDVTYLLNDKKVSKNYTDLIHEFEYNRRFGDEIITASYYAEQLQLPYVMGIKEFLEYLKGVEHRIKTVEEYRYVIENFSKEISSNYFLNNQ